MEGKKFLSYRKEIKEEMKEIRNKEESFYSREKEKMGGDPPGKTQWTFIVFCVGTVHLRKFRYFTSILLLGDTESFLSQFPLPHATCNSKLL